MISVYGRRKIRNMSQVSNPYGCAFCQDTFSNSKTLVTHVQNKHVPDGNIDSKIQEIDEELRKRSNDSFYCKDCDKSFPFRWSLKQHLRIHKEKKWSCKYCLKKFDRHLKLANHER